MSHPIILIDLITDHVHDHIRLVVVVEHQPIHLFEGVSHVHVPIHGQTTKKQKKDFYFFLQRKKKNKQQNKSKH